MITTQNTSSSGQGMAARVTLPLVVAVGLALAAWLPLALADTDIATITICPAGPPACDFPTIQQGLNAAAAGDTVLVEPGTYEGPILLRSDVTLRSSQGSDATTVVADQGPIVFAWHVTSATLAGFTIDGTQTMTNAVGILAIDSQLTLADSAILHMHGAHGTEAHPRGADATGIEALGSVQIIIDATAIRDVHGGRGFRHDASTGGRAAGLNASGEGSVDATGLTVEGLRGGDSNLVWDYANGCGAGGDAIAIETDSAIDLRLQNSLIRDLWGGAPCRGMYFCVHGSGAVAGINARGGSVTVVHTRFQDLTTWRSNSSYSTLNYDKTGYAIRTSATRGVILENNVISQMIPVLFTDWPVADQTSTAPTECTTPAGTMIGIASTNDLVLRATSNEITDIHGMLLNGMGIGINVSSTLRVELLDNVIQNISGGTEYGHDACRYRSSCASGIRVADAVTATVDSNHIGMIAGGDAIVWYACIWSYPGTATGIGLVRVDTSVITNNIVRETIGGKGVRCDFWPPTSGAGGDSQLLHVDGGQAVAANNVFHRALGGAGAGPQAPSGQGYGVIVEGDAQVELANNVTTDSDIAIASAASAHVQNDYNAFWRNATDYEGVPPGQNDLHTTPGFVDLTSGDFMLLADSPLIDAGRSQDAPSHDIEGDPRPLDGNDDGVALTDIGVDEFWLGLGGSDMAAEPLTVRPGEVITYRITLVNDSTRYALAPVTVTNTLPQEIDYVAGSLRADGGVYDYINEMIRWWGALPPGGRVRITYLATMTAQTAGPRSIANHAILAEPVGHAQSVRSVVYVEPLIYYFPVAARSGR